MDNKQSEAQLIKECLKNNTVAQKRLYTIHAKKMMGICLRYADDFEEAQDILQDSFIKVFKNLGKFKGDGSLEGWIRRIVVNTALENYRKNKKAKSNISLELVDYQISKEEHIIESIDAQNLLRLINELPKGYKTIFNLFAIEGYSHKEIAQQLDISENTSKSQYSRARNYIQKTLKSLLQERNG